jgi:hypothetical protein
MFDFNWPPPNWGSLYLGLRALNFIFPVCIWSSGKWRTRRNHWICIEHVTSLRYKLPKNLHQFRDVIFENFRVRMTSFYLTKLFPQSNFDCLYLRQYWSYQQASKHRSASLSQMYSRNRFKKYYFRTCIKPTLVVKNWLNKQQNVMFGKWCLSSK